MLFNSLDFLFFFALLIPTYYAIGRWSGFRAQNVLLLLGSYYFYAYWDVRFLSLILLSTCVDYVIGLRLHAATDPTVRKRLLWLSVSINLGLLAIFKYLGFFVDSFVDLAEAIGFAAHRPTLGILLPVGISFYTFQTMSYTIDIYRRKLKPTTHPLDFALFVAFFPQLVAGPIERARDLLPQLQGPRAFRPDQVREGLHLMVWGLFKKVFVADQVATLVNPVFAGEVAVSGLDLYIVLVAFAMQIYGDFSGYTDIARGVAKVMGIDLRLNFNLPYISKNPSEFWERWHISLSSWLREYLYFSLGGNRHGAFKTYRNLLLTMLLGGLWHGAAWNFVIWGAFHGAILMVWHRIQREIGRDYAWSPMQAALAIFTMFQFTLVGWLFFRATSAAQIGEMLTRLLTDPSVTANTVPYAQHVLYYCWFLWLIQLFQWRSGNLDWVHDRSVFVQTAFYLYCLLGIAQFFGGPAAEFLYFQF